MYSKYLASLHFKYFTTSISITMTKKLVVAVTGASGAIYAYRLLEHLKKETVYLIISRAASLVIDEELGLTENDFYKFAKFHYDENELNVPVASGSNELDAVIIVPASLSTIAKISNGIEDNLITRVAFVAIKENKKLIVVPRETPIPAIQLHNMEKIATNGGIVLMASPPFYIHPESVDDLVNYMVGKILDIIGIRHNLYKRYKSNE